MGEGEDDFFFFFFFLGGGGDFHCQDVLALNCSF